MTSAKAVAPAPAAAPTTKPTEPCIADATSFGYIGTELAACGTDDAGIHTCWTVDKTTGKVAPRKGAPIPGVGFRVMREKLAKQNCLDGLCWNGPVGTDEDSDLRAVMAAYHPDGKRAAITDGRSIYVFDLATKKVIHQFLADSGQSLSGMWFAGDTVMIALADAGPHAELHVYSTSGKKLHQYDDFFDGNVGITSDGRAIVEEDNTTVLTVLDPKKGRGKVIKRRIAAKPPKDCYPTDPGLDGEDKDPKVVACLDYRRTWYDPYASAIIVDNGGDYLGATRTSLITIDPKTLVEKSRIKLAVCPKPASDDATSN